MVSGSLTAELSNILNRPEHLVDFLATALPAQSSYFIQIVIVALVLNIGLELLRVFPLGMAFIGEVMVRLRCINPDNPKWQDYIRPLDNPYEFEHSKILANTVVLFFLIFFVYTVVAPISNFFLAIGFLLLESTYRYQFYHNYAATPDSGGKLWRGFIDMVHLGMVIAQLTLIGLLLLKKSFYAVCGFGPLLAITSVFIWHVHTTRFRVTEYLPCRECIQIDRNHVVYGLDLGILRSQYLQPSIRKATLFVYQSST
jgi:hypothetical protein